MVTLGSEHLDKMKRSLKFMFSSTISDAEFPMKKSSRSQMLHRIIEKRRRDRMNNCLADLSRLIPQKLFKQGHGRIEKTEIIEMSIRHIQQLDGYIKEMKRVTNQCSQEQFDLGYRECQNEVICYLVEKMDYDARNLFCVKLMEHLTKQSKKAAPRFPVVPRASRPESLKEEAAIMEQEIRPSTYYKSMSSSNCKQASSAIQPFNMTPANTGIAVNRAVKGMPDHFNGNGKFPENLVFNGNVRQLQPHNSIARDEDIHSGKREINQLKSSAKMLENARELSPPASEGSFQQNDHMAPKNNYSLPWTAKVSSKRDSSPYKFKNDFKLRFNTSLKAEQDNLDGLTLNGDLSSQAQYLNKSFIMPNQADSNITPEAVKNMIQPRNTPANVIPAEMEKMDTNQSPWEAQSDGASREQGSQSMTSSHHDMSYAGHSNSSSELSFTDLNTGLTNSSGYASSGSNSKTSSQSERSSVKSGQRSPPGELATLTANLHSSVPGFALHPAGTYYIPIIIPVSQILAFLHGEGLGANCHPISIPVNFGVPMLPEPGGQYQQQLHHQHTTNSSSQMESDAIQFKRSNYSKRGIQSNSDTL